MAGTLDNLEKRAKEDEMKSTNQEEAEKLASEASENLRVAKRIMENMTRRKRATTPVPPPIVYERR